MKEMKPVYFEEQDKVYNEDGDIIVGASERNYINRMKQTCILCGGTGIIVDDALVGYGRDSVMEPVEYGCPKCLELKE
jgi:hypothetical protein